MKTITKIERSAVRTTAAKPDRSGWVLNIRISPSLEQEVIDLSKGVPRIATITTSKDGRLLTLGGSYENWTDG